MYLKYKWWTYLEKIKICLTYSLIEAVQGKLLLEEIVFLVQVFSLFALSGLIPF